MLKFTKSNDPGHFSISGDEPFRVEFNIVSAQGPEVVCFVYRGAVTDEEQEPDFVYESELHEEYADEEVIEEVPVNDLSWCSFSAAPSGPCFFGKRRFSKNDFC